MEAKLKPCPIPITHNRLIEAHHLWHQAANSYQDPVGFHANLNATIQTLRNITFALQNEKKVIPHFDEWYELWREKFKKDEVLLWLDKARTKVVHQTDLETKSKAIATVQTYLDVMEVKIEIPPFLPTEHIVTYIIKEHLKDIPSFVREHLLIKIERRWVEKNLENWELLDALSYSFKELKELVYEAHQIIGCTKCDIYDSLHFTDILSAKGKLKCMEDFNDIRVKTFSIESNQFIDFEIKHIVHEENELKKAAKRYKFNKDKIPRNLFSSDAIKMAESMVEFSKGVLAKDKYHTSIVFLRLPEGRWQMYNMTPNDRSEKFALWRLLSEEVERTKADALVDINEVWIGDINLFKENGIYANEQSNRKEALVVSLATSEGLRRSYVTFFTKNLVGKIIFEKTEVVEQESNYYLLPVFEKWKNNK